jgi:putative metallohydrolase (TIGR04338 family)
MRETVVLHEIAHWLTPHGASHGTEFQSAFMWLLDHVVAPEAGFVFRFFLAQAVR